MVETELYTSILRMLLGLMVPITAVVVAFSLLGALLMSLLSIRDEVVIYSLRFMGVLLTVVFLWPGLSNLLLEETQRLLTYGF